MAEVGNVEEAIQIDQRTSESFGPMLGLQCCRLRVGRARSLSIGFGAQHLHGKANMPDPFYGEWEIGTYCGAWRVVHEGVVVCGSQDLVESNQDLDQRLRASVSLGRILELRMLSALDVRLAFDDGIFVDVLAVSADTSEDELFHIFGPGGLYIEYSTPGGWKVGRSDRPWT